MCDCYSIINPSSTVCVSITDPGMTLMLRDLTVWGRIAIVLGKDLMDYGKRSGKSLSLGMHMAPQDNLRTPKSQSLGMPRKESPLSSSSIGNFTWSYIFYSPHDMCFAWSVLYDLSLCFLVCHNHPCWTHLLREIQMNWNVLEYSMYFTYIFWAR